MRKKNIADMFNDPMPNSYPEEDEEFFLMLEEDGVLPKDVNGPDAAPYEAWLEKRAKAASKLKTDGAV